VPRRELIHHAKPERRATVDRRRGTERRSTIDRRRRPRREGVHETPGEHVRNSLQLLMHVNVSPDLSDDAHADLAAAVERLRRALRLLEYRTNS
jgi:hypothetical protein